MPIKHVLTKEEGNYSSEYYLQIISSRKIYYIFYTDTDSFLLVVILCYRACSCVWKRLVFVIHTVGINSQCVQTVSCWTFYPNRHSNRHRS